LNCHKTRDVNGDDVLKKEIGLYIHIPFCKSKCYYCDFVSFANKEQVVEDYIQAVIKEIENANLSKYNINTVYIGGGTPSLINSIHIGKILETIKRNTSLDDTEITAEVNPGTVCKGKLKDYISFGINRLSIGLQSANDNLLKQIGRIHNYDQFLETYKTAREVGFKNINIDLMLGLPNQSLDILRNSLDKVILLDPEHISLYSLILEEGTKLYDMVEKSKLKMISEDLERKMYWETKKALEEAGYIHYEISNFAKTGYSSKHNIDCWNQKEYIGIGAASHSYLDKTRYSNTTILEDYINNINSGNFGNNIIIHENQTKESSGKEYMLLGLRKINGVMIKEYKNKFGENPIFKYKKELERLINSNLIEIDGDCIKLTDKGLDFANIVWEEFV